MSRVYEPPQDMRYETCNNCGAQFLVYTVDPTHNDGFCSDWCHQQAHRNDPCPTDRLLYQELIPSRLFDSYTTGVRHEW